jgi:hypothetical protein
VLTRARFGRIHFVGTGIAAGPNRWISELALIKVAAFSQTVCPTCPSGADALKQDGVVSNSEQTA